MGSKPEEGSSCELELGQYSRYGGFIDWRNPLALAPVLRRSSIGR